MGIYKGNFDVEMLVTRLHNKFTGGRGVGYIPSPVPAIR
jgi:hypothetical protein